MDTPPLVVARRRVTITTAMQSTRGEASGDGNSSRTEAQTLSQFALVCYIPDPLGRFLDDLRLELTPGCRPHAHVTILPPRPLHDELKDSVRQIADDVRGIAPFRIETGDIEIFDSSHVVY